MCEVPSKGENHGRIRCCSENDQTIALTCRNVNSLQSFKMTHHENSRKKVEVQIPPLSHRFSDTSFVFPVEVCCTAPPSALDALKCLLREYLSEHLEEFLLPLLHPPRAVSFSSPFAGNQSSEFPPAAVLSRTTLLVPILSTAPRPLLQYIHSARLGEYGPLSLLASYVAHSYSLQDTEVQDPFGVASAESEILFQSAEDEIMFAPFLDKNTCGRKEKEHSKDLPEKRESAHSDHRFFTNFLPTAAAHSSSFSMDASSIPSLANRMSCVTKSGETQKGLPGMFSSAEEHGAAVQRCSSEGGAVTATARFSSKILPPHASARNSLSFSTPIYDIHFFQLHTRDLEQSETGWLSANSTNTRIVDMCDDGDENARARATRMLPLPHAQLEGLWESLLYGHTLHASRSFKLDLLQYMQTSLLFSFAKIDPHTIHWSRLILLYGPPGTGKTSLCKAIAHKLSIILHHIFPQAVLVEIHSSHIFSRWFSESGKQVMNTFLDIQNLASDRNRFVCVLMDEVESLVMERLSVMQGNEPSDALRVVNIILTQLDALQKFQNVLFLTTSNMIETIDKAFLDRVDKKVYVGPPGCTARRALIRSSVLTLLQKKLVVWSSSLEDVTHLLHEISTSSEGLSGRFLRKVPFLAFHHAFDFTRSQIRSNTRADGISEVSFFPRSCNHTNFSENQVGHDMLEETARSPSGSASINIIDFLRAIFFHVQKECSTLGEEEPKLKRYRAEN